MTALVGGYMLVVGCLVGVTGMALTVAGSLEGHSRDQHNGMVSVLIGLAIVMLALSTLGTLP